MRPTAPLFRAIRRLPLNTKQAGKDFYKGNRTGAMGWHTKYGGYKIDYKKVRTYICPDLSDFNLTPFVAKRIEKVAENWEHHESKSAVDGKEYLRQWKLDGGVL
ncbi:hypothetical protein WHR41_02357 [Cladosporium halotolerans]|uniref:Mitochondrial ribosomal protein L27 n=1 Tax=Cladosporium halotolerans TaxID=1052096 RepID=A0AB34KV45_9PEZI